jgi:hypothetical protein
MKISPVTVYDIDRKTGWKHVPRFEVTGKIVLCNSYIEPIQILYKKWNPI